jgi:hypothetical protein
MPKLKNESSPPESVLIEVPVADVPPQTWGYHINTRLTPDQSHALRCVTAALDARQARLANNQRVVNVSGALKYLLERIGSGQS